MEQAEQGNTELKPFQISPELVEKFKKKNELQKQLEDQQEAAHDEFWAEVHKAYPELDEDGNYSLDAKYEDSGIIILKETAERPSLPEPLKELLLNAIKKGKVEALV